MNRSIPPRPGQGAHNARLGEMLRVDQAGELAAVHIAHGDPADEIVRLADERSAGAVVMGTHGRSGVSHALFGSVTEATLRRLRCPVLAVHA